MLEKILNQKLEEIKPLDVESMRQAEERWKTVAKPLHSLGKLEEAVIRMAGIREDADFIMKKKGLVIFCADNGVVAEGVTQTGQEVTAIVADNFTKGATSVCIMAEKAGVDVLPVDIGMAVDVASLTDPSKKISYGTENMAHGPAMTREQAIRAILTGIEIAGERKAEGYDLLATGEMGIGNTTTSSAVASVLLKQSVESMTGRGAGLTSEGLVRKIAAIRKAIEVNQPDPEDAVDVLAKVGGLDIAGMTGVFLGGAVYHIPVVMDGFISCVAALIAMEICPAAGDYIIASHVSKEPAAHLILEHMKKEAILHADMCLGEGTGAVALFPILDLAAAVYSSMSTFDEIHVEQYEELK